MVITMIDTKYKIKSKKNDIFPFINGIIMVLFVIVTLYPVLNTLAISLNVAEKIHLEKLYDGFT